MQKSKLIFSILFCWVNVTSGGFMLAQPGAVTGVTVTAYDHHVELNWDQHPNPTVNNVRVYGSSNGTNYTLLGSVNNVTTSYVDFVGDFDVTGSYSSGP
jgi:hypothetical protein